MMKHVGMVLAAGASSRMQQPKALLMLRNGMPLAQYQHDLLKQAGCAEVTVVLGCQADFVSTRSAGCPITRNPAWETGRLSSVKAGIRALQPFDGCVILPVDTVGVDVKTVRQLLEAAENRPARAIRPVYAGEHGKVVWISGSVAAEILALDSGEGRLDHFLEKIEIALAVSDSAILNNINTPGEWEGIQQSFPTVYRPEISTNGSPELKS